MAAPDSAEEALVADYPVISLIAALVKDGLPSSAGQAARGAESTDANLGSGAISWEHAGCMLWDMSASEGCARSMLQHKVCS